MFNKGISYIGALLDMAVEEGVVVKSGAWFSFGEERLGQGRENVKNMIEGNADLFKAIDTAVKRKIGLLHSEDGGGQPDGKKAAAKPEESVTA